LIKKSPLEVCIRTIILETVGVIFWVTLRVGKIKEESGIIKAEGDVTAFITDTEGDVADTVEATSTTGVEEKLKEEIEGITCVGNKEMGSYEKAVTHFVERTKMMVKKKDLMINTMMQS
jgi:hypothetical protein